jgi:aspartate/tyrosine/aromatic aminotransferase
MAQDKILQSNLNKEYPAISGVPEYVSSLQNIFFPNGHEAIKEERTIIFHSITGGTALRLCSEMIQKFLNGKVHLSNVTFSPYLNLFNNLEINYYPYYCKENQSLDIDSFVEYLNKLESASVVNLQLSSHNPTCLDPSKEEWDRIAEAMDKKHHVALLDVAYLGYANGSIEEDLYPVYKFAEKRIEMMIAYSSAKNFTNYSDDIGGLILIFNNKDVVMKIKSHLIVLARSLYSFVSLYGSRIIYNVVLNNELKDLWLKEQRQVFDRIIELRKIFIEEVEKQGVKLNTDFLRKQKGIYIFLDLNKQQLVDLRDKHAIFFGPQGRVNITGLRKEKIGDIVKALNDII